MMAKETSSANYNQGIYRANKQHICFALLGKRMMAETAGDLPDVATASASTPDEIISDEGTPLGWFGALGRNFLVEEILERLDFSDLTVLRETSSAWRDLLEAEGWHANTTTAPNARLQIKDFVGSVARLRWALSHNYKKWDTTTCAAIASGGELSVLQWARENGCPWDDATIKCSARHGHLELLKWAVEHGCPCREEEVCDAAARGGQLEVLKWLRSRGCEWSTETFIAAIKSGDLDTIRWLRENECGWDEDTCEVAAKYRHFEVLKWAVESGCHMFNEAEVFSFAVQYCDAEMIEWLRERGLEYGKWTCHLAAECGQLDVLRRLHKEGCPLDNTTCYLAARKGRVDVLKWLWETGFQWNTDDAIDVSREDSEAAEFPLLSRRRRIQEQAGQEKATLLARMEAIYDAQSRRDDASSFEVFITCVKSQRPSLGGVSRCKGHSAGARHRLLDELQQQLQQLQELTQANVDHGPCVVCGINDNEGMICDGCDRVFHTSCVGISADELEIMIEAEEDWFCGECVATGQII